MEWILRVAGLFDAEEWQALASIGTLGVATAAAAFAWFQVREAARLRREQSRPYVVVYVDRPSSSVLDLVVKNFGSTAAREIRLKWDRVPMMRWEKQLEPMELFDVLPLLVPGQEWRTVWDLNGHRIEDDEASYLVTVTSQDARRRRLPGESFTIGTSHFAHEMMMTQSGLHEIGESLRKIEQSTSSWTAGTRGLNVYSRDGDAKDKANFERYEARRAERNRRASRQTDESPLGAKKKISRKKRRS